MASAKHKVKPGSTARRQSDTADTDGIHSDHGQSLRICLVTTEFHGLFKNGGIGTANTGLALALSSAGHNVTVAFADADKHGPRIKEGNFADLTRHYAQLGITLDFVPAHPNVAKGFEDPRSASYCVYLYLREHPFDVVYFNDCGGQGFFSLLAKHTGVFAQPPRMYVVAHGPHEWVLDLNSLRYWDRTPIITAYLERRCAAMADALISPSQYLVDWMIAHDWIMPRNVHVIQNIIPLTSAATRPFSQSGPRPVTEIVFFGRLEVRKGVELFCDAIDLLNQEIDISQIKITFMGKFSHVAGLHSGMYVMERARSWRSSLRLITRYGQEEALAYLARPQVMAVMPSSAENSPCVVAECLQLEVAFVATNTGGTVELVAPEDRDECLADPNPEAIARMLKQALRDGQRVGTLAISQKVSVAQWMQLTVGGTINTAGEGDSSVNDRDRQKMPDDSVRPLVSICLSAAFVLPGAKRFLQSLLCQNYPKLEFVLIDDGRNAELRRAALATIQQTRPKIELQSIATSSFDRGAQRNLAAAAAKGEYLLFVEEDRVELFPECISVFVTAAMRVQASLVSGVPIVMGGQSLVPVEPNITYLPIGASTELGGIENCFGGGAFLVARQAFNEIGGFEEATNPDIEDWHFLASTALNGLSLEIVPEPQFRFRTHPAQANDHSRAVDGYRKILNVYSSQKAGLFRHVIESVVHVEQPRDVIQGGVLEDVRGEALAIARHVSSTFDANSDEALRGFVQFCIERHRVQEALDFALYNRRALLSDAIGAAKTLTESIALDEIRGHTLDFLHDIVLTDDVRERIRTVSAFPARGFSQPPGSVAAYALDNGVTVLKAAAVSPKGAKFLRATARLESLKNASVFLALAVSAPAARLRLSANELESNDRFWWSKWLSVKEHASEDLNLEVSVLDSTDGLLDLHLLCRTEDEGSQPEGKITWSSVTATVSVHSTITASEITEETTPVPRHLIDQGVLLTPSTEFTFPIFVPGDSTLVHPLPRRTVLVRIGESVPAGSIGVKSVVSLQLADSHPVQFAVWVRPSSRPAANETEFGATDAFSGWFTVRDKFRRHSFSLSLAEPAKELMDIYLATRVVEYPDVHFCHAVWHDLLILDGPESAGSPYIQAAETYSTANEETQATV